jgi:Ca-activated chloride channel homolog
MKHEKIFSSRPLLALVVLSSLIFSACAGEASRNSDVAVAETQPTTAPAIYNTSNTAARAVDAQPRFDENASGERYAEITENPFLDATRAPLSTFSIDVDTASYANVRRFLNEGRLPPKDAVRIEEMINYFEYDYPQPAGDVPFSVTTETAVCPWNTDHKLVQIGLQGKKIALDNTPPANLVFLVDVSGSMNSPDKLPLLKESLRTMVGQLKPQDRIAVVVYAGSSGLALPSTPAGSKGEILAAIDRLEAGGSTNGGQGIQLAYSIAEQNFTRGGNNRLVLATDGDFNVGLTGDDELVRLIEQKRDSGIFLSVLGFGTGNLNDSMMEKLADKGNGNYSYIDTRDEARKALGEQVAGTLYTIAKDVKIQVEFNPARVAGYRLIGYENRLLANRDFNDDRKDAGEIGAGHSVTALYEVVPAGHKLDNDGIDLKYSLAPPSDTRFNNELMTVKLRYKQPEGTTSRLLTMGVLDSQKAVAEASDNLRFASAVAQFGLILRDSRYRQNASFASARSLAESSVRSDLKGYRGEFLDLLYRAKRLKS